MADNARSILEKILLLTGRREGKDLKVDDFLTYAHMHAMTKLIEALPKGEQNKVIDLFTSQPRPSAEEIFGPYYTRQQMQNTLRASIKAAFEALVFGFQDLSDTQRDRCLGLIEELTC
jgi:hypothetical protein